MANNEEKLLFIREERAKLNRCYTDEILMIIADELIKTNNGLLGYINRTLDSIEYNVRTKR